jgi:hypothetical protein
VSEPNGVGPWFAVRRLPEACFASLEILSAVGVFSHRRFSLARPRGMGDTLVMSRSVGGVVLAHRASVTLSVVDLDAGLPRVCALSGAPAEETLSAPVSWSAAGFSDTEFVVVYYAAILAS